VRDEIEARRRGIARRAAELVAPDDVLLIDGGPTAAYLAEALKSRLAAGLHGLTVITNSVTVFDLLNRTPGLILISTGGALRYSSQLLVGPTAENALADLRADKLFLSVSGLTPDFGLSHMNISEVTVKSAMIHSARQVILLADHTVFGQESVIQLAPLTVIHQLVTDDAAPAGLRLEFSKLGIQVILAPNL
jgi:DeoR family fructose operon transcriptional repressor